MGRRVNISLSSLSFLTMYFSYAWLNSPHPHYYLSHMIPYDWNDGLAWRWRIV